MDDRASTSAARAWLAGVWSVRIARVTPTPFRAVEALERNATLPEGAGERFSGYAIVALSFKSGHVLALRRFAASSIGPAYHSVWHRDQSHRWTFYETVSPDLSCARYFGGQVHRNVVGPIEIAWDDAMTFRVLVRAGIEWHVTLGTSPATALIDAAARILPERVGRMPAARRLTSMAMRTLLGTGPMNLEGLTPNGHHFSYNCQRLWLVTSSRAVVNGVDLGPVGPLAAQSALGDFLLPQRGLFAVARARFEQPSRSFRSVPQLRQEIL